MNAIEREFNMEVKQKKNISYGAYHKKGGAKSKKCSLPSDNLTAAQKRKLNGPVQTYAINLPMTWEEFKSMPLDLQQEHITYIQSRFACGLGAVSKYVFGLSQGGLPTYASAYGLEYKRYPKGHRGDNEGLRLWANGLQEATEAPEPSEETVPNDVVTAAPEEKRSFADLRDLPELLGNGKLCMSGRAEDIIPRLLALIGGNNAWLSVHLSFTS